MKQTETLALPFYKVVLKGIGQIMLQESVVTGLLFLLGVLYGSWAMCFGMVLGTATATFIGTTFKKHINEYNMGLYGFNGALVGTAVVFSYGLTIVTVLSIIIGSVLSTYVMQYAILKKLPVFTFPFILSSWIVVGALAGIFKDEPHDSYKTLSYEPIEEIVRESFMEELENNDKQLEHDEFLSSLHSFGEVIFQGSLITGLLFFIGVYYNDPIAGIYGIIGAVIASLIGHVFSTPGAIIDQGLLGFNAVLCAITFAGATRAAGIWVLLSCSLSVFIYYLMDSLGVPIYTFPFVAATWCVLLLKFGADKIQGGNLSMAD